MLSAVVTSLCFGSVASAQDLRGDQPPTKTVEYRDLNLATAEGQATFRHRVAWAVQSVCPTPDFNNLAMLGLINKCRRDAAAKSAPLVVAAIERANQRLAGEANHEVAAR